MGGLGHSEVFSAWGILSLSYIKWTGSHTTTVQMRDNHLVWCLPHRSKRRIITSSNAYHKTTKWFFHHMNGLVLFRRYTWSLDTLELSVLIAFLLFITIGKVCMFKSEMSLLGVNNVIKWERPSPFDNSCFLHSLFRACFIVGHVI
jgi:hypothetical protein